MMFLFSVADSQGVCREQEVTLRKPVLDARRPMWVCEVSWRGPINETIGIYGATSLQSLSLAINHIQSEMASVFRDHAITECDTPWFAVPD